MVWERVTLNSWLIKEVLCSILTTHLENSGKRIKSGIQFVETNAKVCLFGSFSS